ncbi:MAG: hypothetical protein ACJ75J_11295 [Cytophagaceae bacterium]
MSKKNILILLTIIIFSGLVVYFIEQLNLPKGLLYLVVFGVAIGKIYFFLIHSYKKLINISRANVTYFNFMLFVAMNIFLMVVSFCADYFCIFVIDPNSFSGVEDATTIPEQLFKFFYLSFLLFTNMGVANVVPVAIAAECMVMFEAIISFITIIFILSDFANLKDSLVSVSRENKKDES